MLNMPQILDGMFVEETDELGRSWRWLISYINSTATLE